MGIKSFLKKLRCKFFICCKVSFNEALKEIGEVIEEKVEEVVEDTIEITKQQLEVLLNNSIKNTDKKRTQSSSI